MTILNVTICAKVAIYADNDKRLAYVFNYFKMLQVAQDLAIILFVSFIILVFNSHDLNNEVHRKTSCSKNKKLLFHYLFWSLNYCCIFWQHVYTDNLHECKRDLKISFEHFNSSKGCSTWVFNYQIRILIFSSLLFKD